MIPVGAIAGSRRRGGGGGIGWTDLTTGALVNRTSDVAVSANGSVVWNNEIYDTSSFHDNSSNTDWLTAPANGLYRVIGNTRSATGGFWYLNKNGSSFPGQAYERSDTDGAEDTNLTSAIISAVSGDDFTIHSVSALTLTATGGVISDDGQSWFAIEAIAADKPFARASMSGNQAVGVTNTWAAVAFDTEDADSHGFYSAANNYFEIPDGVTLARFSANLRYDGTTTDAAIRLTKNVGGSWVMVDGVFRKDESGSATKYINAVSAIIEVSAGEQFRLEVQANSTGDVIAGDATWFQVEAIHPDAKYCLAKPTGGSVGSSNYATLAMGGEVADALGAHDNSTDNSRITVPSGQGITQARASFGLTTNGTGQLIGRVIMNGGTSIMIPGLPCDECQTATDDGVTGLGAWIDVDEGDYFELQGYGGSGGTILLAGGSWLQVEFR